MLSLPEATIPVTNPFATFFQCRTWTKIQVLLASGVLAPGQRTAAAAL